MRTPAQTAVDPHVIARDALQTVAQSDGTDAPITAPPAKLSRTPIRVRTGARGLGADTEEILREIGLSDDEILELRREEVA